ncbi:MAG TPA: hypothetical protein EYG28_03545 [Nitrospiria bacterium]|nr:hypothetical protein [Candidatus Manganitrophaceae bacterium]HIL34464.1 hypothetical protein [Candidatus Manganitrophaceae bacterium]
MTFPGKPALFLAALGGVVGAGAQTVVTEEIVDLDPDITFFWKVTADDRNGGITDSETWSFTTTP